MTIIGTIVLYLEFDRIYAPPKIAPRWLKLNPSQTVCIYALNIYEVLEHVNIKSREGCVDLFEANSPKLDPAADPLIDVCPSKREKESDTHTKKTSTTWKHGVCILSKFFYYT